MSEPADLEVRLNYALHKLEEQERDIETLRELLHKVNNLMNPALLWIEGEKKRRAREKKG